MPDCYLQVYHIGAIVDELDLYATACRWLEAVPNCLVQSMRKRYGFTGFHTTTIVVLVEQADLTQVGNGAEWSGSTHEVIGGTGNAIVRHRKAQVSLNIQRRTIYLDKVGGIGQQTLD